MSLTFLQFVAIVLVIAGVTFTSGGYFVGAAAVWFVQTLFNAFI